MVRGRSTSVKGLSLAEVEQQGVDPLFLVWLASRSVSDLMDRVVGGAGLTGDEFAIYSVLAASPGITPGELSRWMAAPATTVSSYVKRFEGRGHVSRTPNPEDRRSYQLQLTAAGRSVHRRASTLFGPVRAEVVQTLGADESRVRESLLQLRSVVDDLRSDRAGTDTD